MKNKIFKNFMVLFIPFLLIEIVFRLILKFNLFGWSSVRIIIELGIICMLFSILFSFLPNKVNKYFNMFLVLASSIYAIAQVGLYNFIGVFFSFNSSSQVGKILNYIIDYVKGYSWYYYLVFIPFILLLLYYIFLDKKVNNIFTEKKLTNYILPLVIIALLSGAFYGSVSLNFMQNKYQSESNIELIKYGNNPNLAVNQFGINSFFFIDVSSLFTEEKEIVIEKKEEEKEIITDNSRLIDDTLWQEIIVNEKNKTNNQINNYLINRSITNKNSKTGVFEDKNIIAILMESINTIPLQYPEYFPTINKLYNEGWSWVNNYTPRNSCSTGNNEMVFLTSLYTINNSCTANKYQNNTYMESMFNLFKDKGYYTSSYHDYADAYYYRNTIHSNMGVDKYYNAYKLGIKINGAYEEWPSDTELFNKSVDKYINEDKFFTFYSTVTTHRPYTVSSEFGDKNIDLFKDLDLSKTSKRYLSKIKELDDGLKILLEKLEEYGKLDDTVIVLFADHYPYGLSNNQIKEFLGSEALVDYERDRTPFVIYNNSMIPEKNEVYTSIVNALPTIANLFNLNYDPRYYMGTDLYSEDYEEKVVFSDGSWRNKDIMYSSSTNNIKYYHDNVTIDDQKIITINDQITNDIKISNLIIKNNYFNYLEKLLSKYQKVSENVEKNPKKSN